MSDVRCPAGNIEIEASGRFRTRYLARIQSGHEIADVLSPTYFGMLIPLMGFREFDMIEVEWEDGSKWGMLQVRAVEPTLQMVTVKERIEIADDAFASELPENWSMKFVGGQGKWAIYCGDEQMDAGFPTPERARNRIAMLAVHNAHKKAMQGDSPTVKKKPGRPPKASTDTQMTAEAAEA